LAVSKDSTTSYLAVKSLSLLTQEKANVPLLLYNGTLETFYAVLQGTFDLSIVKLAWEGLVNLSEDLAMLARYGSVPTVGFIPAHQFTSLIDLQSIF
jgi:hypothetical protein